MFLCGGGSGEKAYEATKKLNDVVDHGKPILYVPLAMDKSRHPYDGCFEWIKEELKFVDVPNVEMVTTFDDLVHINSRTMKILNYDLILKPLCYFTSILNSCVLYYQNKCK